VTCASLDIASLIRAAAARFLSNLQALALFFSPYGQLAPAPFGRAVVAIYLLAFLSQLLVSPPLLAHAGAGPFALVQGLATWSWFCLHAKRLRDSGAGIGAASAIAILYGLAVLLFLLTVMLVGDPPLTDATVVAKPELSDFFILFLFLAMLLGDANLGLFAYVMIAVLLLILIPILLAFGFSWVAFRRPTFNAAD
jgi:hypothetical protein